MTSPLRWSCLPLLLGACASAAELRVPDDVQALLDATCIRCHDADKKKGELDLTKLIGEGLTPAALRTWRTARARTADHEMPPKEAKSQPSEGDRQKLVAWLSGLKYDGPKDPGRVTVRRLNRAEYDNTVRDLVGVDLKLASDFPSDDVGEGFDDLGDVLSLPPILFEKYMAAADRILDRALVREQVQVKLEAGKLPTVIEGKPADPVEGPRTLDKFGEIDTDFPCPADGRYTIRVNAGGDQAGDEPVRLALKVDDQVVQEFRVVRTALGPQSASVQLERGPRKLAVVFLNPFTDTGEPKEDAKPKQPGQRRGQGAQQPPKPPPQAAQQPPKPATPKTRTVRIGDVEIVGPPSQSPTESHRRIVFVHPGKGLDKRDAARQVIARFAERAFRRPPTEAELTALLAIVELADGQGRGYVGSLRFGLQAILVSPQFLFRVEKDRRAEADGVYRIDDWELASRLSYFLWSSMPDDNLFALARAGTLHQPEVLAREVQRMLKDGRSRALVDNFFGQWLEFRNLATVAPDPKTFPEFDKYLRAAMAGEVETFCEMLVKEDRSVLELIDSDYTYLNDKLAKLYGIDGVTGAVLRKVQLSSKDRGGVLTMAATLTITSAPNRTIPVKRGKFILEQLLDDPPPPPPGAVASLAEQTPETKGLTLRERLEKHRSDPTCASCHERMDPIGFAFEHYDAIGRWRETDNGKPIDSTGELPSGTSFAGAAQLKALFLAQKDAFVRCMAEKMLVYALGRAPIAADDVALTAISDQVAKDGFKISAMVQAIAASYPFQYRKTASGGQP